METGVYKKMAEIEGKHWWFRGRAAIVESFIKRFSSNDLEILDAGCGSGGNFGFLKKYGAITGLEPDDYAAKVATEKNIAKKVYVGGFPVNDNELKTQKFDLVLMTDVLEHIEDDKDAMNEVFTLLNSGGKLVATVPAFMFLWSQHDKTHHHFRRYTKKELRQKLENAGFKIEFISYYNFFLFPAVFAVRMIKKLFGVSEKSSDLAVPPSAINKLFFWLFSLESLFLRYLRFPFGVSVIVVARKL